ncbi:MAG: Omp28-related outer membrane protein [Tidjanibacter sp.]|nr:Omp28-related outer membrane protein [Tidjanibacter sp.]
MKLTKIFAVAVAAMVALTACRGTEEDNQFQGDGTGFKVTASAGVIYADGSDKVVFTATFDGLPIQSTQEITAYNKEDGNIVPLEALTFTTTEAGEYIFYFTYDKEGATHTSEDIKVVAVVKQPLDFSDNDEVGLSVTASHKLFQVGVDEVYLIVRRDGKVLDAMMDDEVTFYDYNNKVVAMGTKRVTDDNGVEKYMYRFNPKEAGIYSFWASVKTLNTQNKPVRITAMDMAIPMAAIDMQPDNTSFTKRSVLFQLTGTACPNCPRLIQVIKRLWNNPDYADKFVHIGVHTYNATDPMYYKEPGFVQAIGGIESYPAYVFDLRYSGAHSSQTFQREINEAQATPAKAGIAARIQCDGVSALARVSVKAAEEGEYCVAAMLLESNITAIQQGDQTGECKVHENALRLADGKNKGYYVGHSLGTLKAGETAEYLFNMPLGSDWVQPNCHIVFYVTTPDESGKSYHVTNAVASESLNCTVEYDYKN